MSEPSKTVTGPRGYPLVGNLLAAKRDMLGFFQHTVRDHGDIAFFRLGPLKIYYLTHPRYIQHVLLDTHNIYIKSPVYNKLQYLLGQGLLTSDGAFWRRQRKLAQPAFNQTYIATLAEVMGRCSMRIAERWEGYAKAGTQFDVCQEMMELTLEIIMQTMFGASLQEDVREISAAMHVILEDLLQRSLSPFPIPLFVPTPHNLQMKRAKHFFDKIIFRVIAEHRKKKSDQSNLLSMLCAARDEETGEMMSDLQLRDEVMTIFMAGHETTATALSWTWYLLGQNPDVEVRLRQEITQVLAGRLPTFQDVTKLVYTRMVLEESMRLYPPIWAISRTATQDDEIDGYRIPRGSVVMMGIYSMHRHQQYWPYPDKFDPERFRNEASNRERKYIYMPFGGGARVCIGNQFAMMEGAIILATLMQRVRLKLVPGHPVVPQALLTLKAKHGVAVHAEKV